VSPARGERVGELSDGRRLEILLRPTEEPGDLRRSCCQLDTEEGPDDDLLDELAAFDIEIDRRGTSTGAVEDRVDPTVGLGDDRVDPAVQPAATEARTHR